MNIRKKIKQNNLYWTEKKN